MHACMFCHARPGNVHPPPLPKQVPNTRASTHAQAVKNRDMSALKDILKRYTIIPPPSIMLVCFPATELGHV